MQLGPYEWDWGGVRIKYDFKTQTYVFFDPFTGYWRHTFELTIKKAAEAGWHILKADTLPEHPERYSEA